MTWVQWTDQGLSFALVMVCWWLAHHNAVGKLPLGRAIAICWSIFGMAVLGNMLLRAVADLRPILPYTLLISKSVLLVTLGIGAARLIIIDKKETRP